MTNIANSGSLIVSKRAMQSALKRLRNVGYTVNKVNSGYTVYDNEELILKAMIGTGSYLVRYNKDYIDREAI